MRENIFKKVAIYFSTFVIVAMSLFLIMGIGNPNVSAEENGQIVPYAGINEQTVFVDGVGVKVTIDPKDMLWGNYVDIKMVLTNNSLTNIARFDYRVSTVEFYDSTRNLIVHEWIGGIPNYNFAQNPNTGVYNQSDIRSATVTYKAPSGTKYVNVIVRIRGNNHATGIPDILPLEADVVSGMMMYND